ncbi:MAG: ATP-binding protein [Zetaproteobacteria bacterium CG_4_9_14_3_um_filter_49_83]|nr:MAG: ATP-binding protein [Zetaproteobacteria bacterium CG1_02_49_23]PIQ30116.1 MAG: ATP-binding protein [Zetaproteobacteria bacterium CG17_big_fil_post_rev_8_21_14_2_50_50_13]PIV31514.1 MAG: ATP-binding protein [Zetaproteobacteria bacterium CG02_land_8_20_14_3_00_50_9]PIY55936.1 MAG: ATP-binding protein [Zetaproteobacteria bacterium CG_4_10_14_0_8_um_filter_49_80]PJA36387.1 MAG: ATP-binding protein [Zetaproteobacteria bacterium CG_4_9_14_3_um_filter_49_83]
MSRVFIRIGGKNKQLLALDAAMGNRHGLIAGATGSGKTVSLQMLAEGFSRAGVPVFMADVKGDLSGIGLPGKAHQEVERRLGEAAISDYNSRPYPILLWDIFAEQGHPVRATISDIGPLLLSHVLELNDTQSGVLYATFRIADDNGLLLLDLKDLQSMLTWMLEHRDDVPKKYGNISSASVGAIQRRLLVLEEQGASHFFGEPALAIQDFMHCDFSGQGVISLLDATKLIRRAPKLYATFLLWLLSELFENLPEVGDLDKPKLVLFFDEAHLLFDGAPKALLDKIEQVVRLIRSKGVGVFFVSQSPLDIPEDVLGQLGTRIQHTLRAFTPRDQKAVNSVAATFRPNPHIDTASAITELGIGEALVSTLDASGAPTPVERIWIAPPESQIGPMDVSMRQQRLQSSPMAGKYDQMIDRESACELLQARAETETLQQQQQIKQPAWSKPKAAARASNRQSFGEAMAKSLGRSIASNLGRRIARGLLGSLLGSSK